jgi:GH35 family endo-1,4-beta-xylanase
MISWWNKYVTEFYNDPDYVAYCFKLAEKYFPHNELCINEATGFCWTDWCSPNCAYYSYIENAVLKGARIDAVGMQYHIFKEQYSDDYFRLLNLEGLYKHMDLFAKLGKPLEVTEITIPSYSWEEEDEKLQADILEKLYSLWFSHPATSQIVYWNLVDGYAHLWTQDREAIKASQGDMSLGENVYHGGLLRFDMSPKPAYFRMKELLTERWHTEETAETDDLGAAEFRGFYGDYDVEITLDGRTQTRTVSLSKGKNNQFNICL